MAHPYGHKFRKQKAKRENERLLREALERLADQKILEEIRPGAWRVIRHA